MILRILLHLSNRIVFASFSVSIASPCFNSDPQRLLLLGDSDLLIYLLLPTVWVGWLGIRILGETSPVSLTAEFSASVLQAHASTSSGQEVFLLKNTGQFVTRVVLYRRVVLIASASDNHVGLLPEEATIIRELLLFESLAHQLLILSELALDFGRLVDGVRFCTTHSRKVVGSK